jgi:hypothetical protein
MCRHNGPTVRNRATKRVNSSLRFGTGQNDSLAHYSVINQLLLYTYGRSQRRRFKIKHALRPVYLYVLIRFARGRAVYLRLSFASLSLASEVQTNKRGKCGAHLLLFSRSSKLHMRQHVVYIRFATHLMMCAPCATLSLKFTAFCSFIDAR